MAQGAEVVSLYHIPPDVGISMGMKILNSAYVTRPKRRFGRRPFRVLAAHPWDLPGLPRDAEEANRADRLEQEVENEREAERFARQHVVRETMILLAEEDVPRFTKEQARRACLG